MSITPYPKGNREADATIWIEGSDAVAIDSLSHKIDEGAAHEDVIQSAIDNLPAVSAPYDRTRLLKLRGNFDISDEVLLEEYLTLDLWGAYLQADANIDAILTHDNLGTDYPRKVNLLGGMIDGNKGSVTCSGIHGTFKPLHIYGTNIVRCSDYGVHMHSYDSTIRPKLRCVEASFGLDTTGSGNGDTGDVANSAGLYLHNDAGSGNQADFFITNSKFINNVNAAILCDADTSDIRITSNHFSGFVTSGACRGIVCTSTAGGAGGNKMQLVNNHFEQVMREAILAESIFSGSVKNNNNFIVIGNTFTDCGRETADTYSIIKSETGGGGSNDNWTVCYNHFTNNGANACKYAIEVESGSNDWKIIGNEISSAVYTSGAISMNDNDNVVQWNTNNCDAYQSIAGPAWSDPTGDPTHGTIVTMYNSGAGEYRLYTYANSGWRYETLS